jgi:ankyrin repeat protein
LYCKFEKQELSNDQNLIHYAYHGNLNKVHDLLRAGANVNAQQDDGVTALWIASQQGYADVVRALVDHNKVEVNLRGKNGETALWRASCNGHVDVVRVLLQKDEVDVDHQCYVGVAALWMASWKGYHKVVEVLLESDK